MAMTVTADLPVTDERSPRAWADSAGAADGWQPLAMSPLRPARAEIGRLVRDELWLTVRDEWWVLGAEVDERGIAELKAEARRRGCRLVMGLTYDVLTNQLYDRLGYRNIGTIEDCPAGTTTRWYRKDL
jgi:hypothetical protein